MRSMKKDGDWRKPPERHVCRRHIRRENDITAIVKRKQWMFETNRNRYEPKWIVEEYLFRRKQTE